MPLFTNSQVSELTEIKMYDDSTRLCYTQAFEAGFSSEQIIRIAKQGGLPAITALSELARRKEELDGFLQTNIAFEQIIAVLSHNGGSKNLQALRELLVPLAAGRFFAVYTNASESIAHLAKGPSKSANIGLLSFILNNTDCQEFIITNLLLETLCKKIKSLSAKKIKDITVRCIDELVAFLGDSVNQKTSSKPPPNAKPKRRAEQSAEELQNQERDMLVDPRFERKAPSLPANSFFSNKRRKSKEVPDKQTSLSI